MGFVCCCCCCCFLLCVGRHVVLQLLETAARWQRASVSPFRMIHRIGIRQPVATKKRGRIYERNTTTEWNTHTHTHTHTHTREKKQQTTKPFLLSDDDDDDALFGRHWPDPTGRWRSIIIKVSRREDFDHFPEQFLLCLCAIEFAVDSLRFTATEFWKTR